MAPKHPALTTHHCPGRKEGHGACKDTEKPYNGTTATWCQHYEFCPKHPKQPVYLHNVRSQCRKCQQEERTTEMVRRKKVEEERAKLEASKPSKEELVHQARNNRNLLKEVNKQSRIQERQEATLGDTLDAAQTEGTQRQACEPPKKPMKSWRKWFLTEPVARPLMTA